MKSFVSVLVGALTAALLSTAAYAENLVLYTSQPNEDAQATVDAFQAANPGIEVEWVREGTTKIMAKLMAQNRTDLVRFANRQGMSNLDDEDQRHPGERVP